MEITTSFPIKALIAVLPSKTRIFGFIISIEALNTGIEKICDFVNPDYNKKIGFIKDISAGAVSFAVVASLIAIVLIYYPYLF